MLRKAVVESDNPEIADYLPSGYKVTEVVDGRTFIAGEDILGWTLDGYVIPRLASGLYFCKEIKDEQGQLF